MNYKILPFLSLALISILFDNLTPAIAQQSAPNFTITTKFNPAEHSVVCKTIIENPGDNIFMLTNGMVISKISADGKKVAVQKQFVKSWNNSNQYVMKAPIPGRLVIEYSGKILADSFPKTINSINMVDTGLVELSNYIDWIPRMKNFKSFIYTLQVELPRNWKTITTGKIKSEKNGKGFSRTVWTSVKPGYSLTIISAPHFETVKVSDSKNSVQIFYSELPKSYADSMCQNLLLSFGMLTDLFGSAGASNVARIIYSPRSGGGYSRAPLIMVSEKYALDQRHQKMGQARDFRLNTHEISHYWSKADAWTFEDWINEGLAEYTAFWISEKVCGKEFADMIMDEYHTMINNCPTDKPILEPNVAMMEREVNRYYKPTLLFNDLCLKYGDEKIKAYLTDLYAAFVENKKATTALLLEVTKKSLGDDAYNFLNEGLNRKNWNSDTTQKSKSIVLTDSTFIGTWTGPLSQFGTTFKFVFNLYVKDGILTPWLDSPDHNVKNIPVSDFYIEGDSISFKVGAAAAIFNGKLDKENLVISGVWNQKGAGFPLVLKKE